MAQTVNKYQIIQKVSASDTLLLHPETEAEVVLYKNQTSALASTTTQGAIDEVAAKIKAVTDGGVVTGVKGNSESTYRKGQVNITAANVGAETSGAVSTHNSNGSAHSDIRSAVTTAQGRADSAYSLAEGKSRAAVFDTMTALTSALKTAENTAYKVGDNLYIKATDVPDYWVSAVLGSNAGTYGYYEISKLETDKVDLTGYQTKSDAAFNTAAKTVTGAVNEIKASADSAKAQAETASSNVSKIIDGTTKVAKAGSADTATSATTADSAAKWATSRTLGVSVNSGVKSDGSTAISASGSQSVDGTANKTIAVTLGDSGVAAGTYSAVQVNTKGIAVAGGQMVEIGTSGQITPSASLATGGLFFKMI